MENDELAELGRLKDRYVSAWRVLRIVLDALWNAWVGTILVWMVLEAINAQPSPILCVPGIMAFGQLAFRLIRTVSFSVRLRRDLRDRALVFTGSEERLRSSGMLWSAQGAPAAWRIANPPAGVVPTRKMNEPVRGWDATAQEPTVVTTRAGTPLKVTV